MYKENQSKEDKKVLQKILQNQTFAEPEENSEASAIFYYHADHLGSNEIISDNTGAPHEFHLTLPFGETMAEQRKPVADYYNSWKFTGKELDEETGLYYFGARYYQPSWSVWLSVDPKAHLLPSSSLYVFSLDNPITLVDPDGQYPIYFMIRRYESSGYFGTPFISKGDNRQTSANVNVSARIHHFVGVETNTSKYGNPVFYNNAYSSQSRQYTPWSGTGTETPKYSAYGDVLHNNDRISALNFSLSNSGQEPIAKQFCESCTPAIDTKGIIGVNEFKDKGELQIFGSISGDNFPDAEGFIYDASGNGISLGDYQHAWYGSPMWNLQGEGNENLLNFDITVKVDKNGNFQKAFFMKEGNQIDLKIYNQKETNFDPNNLNR